jgi:amino acid transporter
MMARLTANTAPDTDKAVRRDDAYLARRTGSRRETRRRLTQNSATSLSVSIISFMTGTLGLYGQGAMAGGPAVMIWTWIAFFIPIRCVALSMGEICSAYPTLGGPFYWTYELARKHKKPASWLVAWLNFTGDLAGTAFAAFSAALFIGRLLAVETSFADTPGQQLLIAGGIMVLAGVLNSFAVEVVAWLNRFSMWVHMGGALVISLCLLFFTRHLKPASFVFTHFINGTAWSNPVFVVALGAVVPLLTFTGFDANGHKADETLGASRVAPKAMVRAVELSFIGGLLLLISFSAAIQNFDDELATAFPAVPAQILLDALDRPLAVGLISWIILGQVMCTISCVDAGSRMVVGAARERALVFNRFLHYFTPTTKVPLRAVWVMTVFSFAFCVPGYFGTIWFYGVTAYAAVALFLVYVIPTFLRLVNADMFNPGDFRLARPRLTGWTAVLSIAIASIAASLPLNRHFWHWNAMNWTAPGVLFLVVVVAAAYLLFGRGRYDGPQQHISDQDLAELEADY